MEKNKEKWKSRNIIAAAKNCINGIMYSLKTQISFKIQTCVAIIVIFLSFFFKISKAEALIVCICIFSVLSAEAVNTAIEKTVDMITEEYDERAKIAKDVSAGAVFIVVIGSVIVGAIIFGEKILEFIK